MKTFHIGDHVRWNSEAGRVAGTIVKIVRSNIRWKGYLHHASPSDPQYLIKSDKTDHIAIHKAVALHLASRVQRRDRIKR